jgi:hypothetical protein
MSSYSYDDAGILLEVKIAEDELILRIDKDVLWQGERQDDYVTELVLKRCQNARTDFEKLNESLGEGVEYFISEGDITLVPDTGPELVIACQSISEASSDYTISELRKKCAWLAERYSLLSKLHSDVSRKYLSTMSKLRTEIGKEIDRCQRKLEFFSESNPEKSRELAKRIEAHERLLVLMEQTDWP